MSKSPEPPRGDMSKQHLAPDCCLDLAAGLVPEHERADMLAHAGQCAHCETMLRESFGDRWRAEVGGTRVAPAAGVGFAERIRGFGLRRALPFAACLVLVIVGAALLLDRRGADPDNPPRLFALPSLNAELTFRSYEELDSGRLFADGLRAYQQQRFDRASELLDGSDVPEYLERYRGLYLGSALVFQGQYRRAAEILIPLSEQVFPEPWGNEARWTCLVALHHLRRVAQVDSLLELLAHEDDAVGERARSLQHRSR